MAPEYFDYFVLKDSSQPGRHFQVARREVKTRTRKGYPITFVLRCCPDKFETWEEAQAIANKLKREPGRPEQSSWIELEETN